MCRSQREHRNTAEEKRRLRGDHRGRRIRLLILAGGEERDRTLMVLIASVRMEARMQLRRSREGQREEKSTMGARLAPISSACGILEIRMAEFSCLRTSLEPPTLTDFDGFAELPGQVFQVFVDVFCLAKDSGHDAIERILKPRHFP